VVQYDGKTGKLVGVPDIISRGFIFMKDHKELVDATTGVVKKMIEGRKSDSTDPGELRDKLRDEVGNFLFAKTERRPMVVPVIMEV